MMLIGVLLVAGFFCFFGYLAYRYYQTRQKEEEETNPDFPPPPEALEIPPNAQPEVKSLVVPAPAQRFSAAQWKLTGLARSGAALNRVSVASNKSDSSWESSGQGQRVSVLEPPSYATTEVQTAHLVVQPSPLAEELSNVIVTKPERQIL